MNITREMNSTLWILITIFAVMAAGRIIGLQRAVEQNQRDLEDFRILCAEMNYDLEIVKGHELRDRTRLDIIISEFYRSGQFRNALRAIQYQDSIWANEGK